MVTFEVSQRWGCVMIEQPRSTQRLPREVPAPPEQRLRSRLRPTREGPSPVRVSAFARPADPPKDSRWKRQLNAAIYRTVIVRMRFHEPTIAYVARRTAEGKSKRDIIHCLIRYVIREVHHLAKAKPTALEVAACQP